MYERTAKWGLLLIGLGLCTWLVASQAVSQASAVFSKGVQAAAPPSLSLPPATDATAGDPAAGAHRGGVGGAAPQETVAQPRSSPNVLRPLIVLAVGIAIVLGMIIGMKLNAFLALITAAMVVSLLAEGVLAEKIARVAAAFGEASGKIGVVIALAAVIGKCMLDSGAADRIVYSFLRLFGQKRAPVALMGSGFFLGIPVFFDTVFYLLVPLARSLHRKTRVHYLLYVLAIAVGGAVTHTLVPPTPGPLVMASQLRVDFAVMMMVGLVVAFPAALAGLGFAVVVDRVMPVPMRSLGSHPEPQPLDYDALPPLSLSVAPVLLPVLLILSDSTCKMFPETAGSPLWLLTLRGIAAVMGNPNLAMLLAAVIALVTLYVQRQLTRAELAQVIEDSLMSAGVIILITAAGGAFGAMLQAAQVGPAIEYLFTGGGASGMMILVLGFSMAAVLKIAQGSSTVAMITGSAMLAGVATSGTLGFHAVYLATAIGSGSLVGSWMNDSGFWIYAKMSGLTETEALKSWTPALVVLAVTGLFVTLLLALVLPYPPLTAPPPGVTP